MKRIERIKDKVIITLVYLITIILTVLLLASCEEEKPKENYINGYHIVVIDSCEYIRKTIGYSGYMAHKGNCRFCAERNRRMIREQVDSILIQIYD